jgi:hypothetical protein
VLVVPDGYKGPLRLIIDKEQGIEIPLEDGEYIYRYAENGTLMIKDASPFRHWHSLTAIYANGKPIPIDHEGNVPPDAVSLHFLGSGVSAQGNKEEHYIEDFVGTREEFRKYADRPYGEASAMEESGGIQK